MEHKSMKNYLVTITGLIQGEVSKEEVEDLIRTFVRRRHLSPGGESLLDIDWSVSEIVPAKDRSIPVLPA
jgi:hypothetical protein